MQTGDTNAHARLNASAEPNELADLLGPFWSEAHTRNVLDRELSGSYAKSVATGSVLGVVSSDGDVFYPVFQFRREPAGPEAGVRVDPALVPVLRILRDLDPWTVGVFLHTPAPELDDQTPLACLRSEPGGPVAVLELAQVVALEWAR